MKKITLALAMLAALPTSSFAQTIVIGSASGAAGGPAASVPVAITFTQNPTPTAANTVRDIDARLTYDSTKITPVFGPGTIPGGSCVIGPIGTVIVAVGDNTLPQPNGTICNFTSIAIAAGAAAGPTPLALAKGVGSGCGNAAAGSAGCVYTPGAVTITGAGAPVAQTPATLTFTASNIGVPNPATQNLVLTAGATAGSVAGCTIAGTNPGDFAFFPAVMFPLAVAANATVNLPVRFTPAAANARVATVVCSGAAGTTVTTPLTTLNGTGNPGADLAPVITYTPAPAAAVAFPAGAAGAATATINIATGTVGTGAGTTAVTGCAIGAGFTPAGTVATTPANGIFSVTVTTGSINLGCTRGAATQTASLTCNELSTPPGGAPVVRTWPLTCPAATAAALNVTPPTSSAAAPIQIGAPTLAGTQVGPTLIPVVAPAANTGPVTIASCTAITSTPAGLFNYGTPAPVFPITIAPGATVNIPVFYNPPAGAPPGQYPGTFTCTTGAGNAPATFQVFVNGTVLAPTALNVTPPTSSAAAPIQIGAPTQAGTQVGPTLIPVSAPAGNTGPVSLASCTAITSTPAGLFNYGTPAPVFPITIAPGATVNIPVFYNPPVGAPVGQYPGTFTCTTGAGNAPATFQVFVNGTVVGAPPVVSLVTQVPTLSTLSIWLLVASMLGFGLVMVGRRQA